MQALTFFFAFVAVLALIGVAAWLVRRFAGNRLGANTNRGRMPRLAVIDAAAVDGRRRLVLVRRDNVEHLLMIGGPTDIVVEPNIVRAMPGRDQMPQRPAVGAPEPPPRIAPLPDAGWAEAEGPRADAFDHAEPQMPEPPPRPARPSFADEVRRPAPGTARRAVARRSAGRFRAGAARRPSGAPPRTARRTDAVARDIAQRTGHAPPAAPERSTEGAPGSRAGACRRPPPPPPPPAVDVGRGPESRRDGAAAGGRPSPAGRRAATAVGAPPVAPEPPPAARPAQRATGAPPVAPPRRRAVLKISKTRWRRCWAVRRPLREIGGLPA